jgi:ABC-type Fe3+-hydroxamate transport system substrate-binding protein
MRANDALGREHVFEEPLRRIVSLVPSITETLLVLGLDAEVVGVTDFCVHPDAAVRNKPRVGGTKNPKRVRILSLRPDLVMANKEENRQRDTEKLEAAGVRVFVTHARTVREALEEIRVLGAITRRAEAARAIIRETEAAWEGAKRRARARRPRVVALIWKKPYMAVGGRTFANDMLVQSGATNPFEPMDRRYPRIDENALAGAQPDVILLPTEPYDFQEADRLELFKLDCPAAREGRIHIVEGELLTWYGPRMPRALRLLSELIHS